jgi:hypothetical protein
MKLRKKATNLPFRFQTGIWDSWGSSGEYKHHRNYSRLLFSCFLLYTDCVPLEVVDNAALLRNKNCGGAGQSNCNFDHHDKNESATCCTWQHRLKTLLRNSTLRCFYGVLPIGSTVFSCCKRHERKGFQERTEQGGLMSGNCSSNSGRYC